MREQREPISYRGTSAITTVARSFTFVLVFCFAGCAAGSCLSYGHSCWGAHGKRSGHNYPGNNNVDNEDQRPSSSFTGGPATGNDGESLQDQWILSRLVTRQLNAPMGAEKFRANWYDSNRGRGHGRNWDNNDVEASKSIRREEIAIEEEDDDDEIRDEDVQVLPKVLSRELQQEPRDISEIDEELVLVPPSEKHLKPIGSSHKLRLFKILNGAAGKLK